MTKALKSQWFAIGYHDGLMTGSDDDGLTFESKEAEAVWSMGFRAAQDDYRADFFAIDRARKPTARPFGEVGVQHFTAWRAGETL